VAPILPFGVSMADPSRAGVRVDRTLLIEQAAEILGVSRRTIYYRIREGRLRTIRTRCGSQRVLVSSLEALLRESRRAPGASAEG
jgi:excisionase family DNA binding protein